MKHERGTTKQITISGKQADNRKVEGQFGGVGGRGLIFPLLGVIAAIDTTEERRRSLLERNEKLLDGEYRHLQYTSQQLFDKLTYILAYQPLRLPSLLIRVLSASAHPELSTIC